MKSILKFGIAALLALTPAAAFAAAGDAIFFSISQTDPFAGTALNLNVGASAPLYIWVTSNAETTAITPATTATNPSGSPQGSAAIALTGTRTGTSAAVTNVQYYNNQYSNSPGTANPFRWSEVQLNPNYTNGGFLNYAANTGYRGPNDPEPPLPGAFYQPGTIVGLSSNATVVDSNRIALASPPTGISAGAMQIAWRLGQVTVNGTAAGASTLALSAGTLQITKGSFSPVVNTDLGINYQFGSATINVAPGGRLGDLNADGNVNATDINTLYGYITTNNLAGDLNNSGATNQADQNLLVSTLVDINGVPVSVGSRFGDANLDGGVDGIDFNAWLTGSSGWAQGDFNGDGGIDGVDFNIWLTSPLGLGGGSVAPVPEPTSIALLAMGGVVILGCRRRSA